MQELTDVRPNDEGGIIGLSGLKYQYHYAAKKCLEMILDPNQIEYVASELHDDVVVKFKNDTYGFFQVKSRKGSLWTINLLKHAHVWDGFLRCKRTFGEGHLYRFVSDQDCMNRVSKRPDLGRMQKLTDTTKELCKETDLNDVDEIIRKLAKEIKFENIEEAKTLFWNTRIFKEDFRALTLGNLQLIEKILLFRNIPSEPNYREQIYKTIISTIEEKLIAYDQEATLREKLEARKITPNDINDCFSTPFQITHPNGFDFNPNNERTLIQKIDDAGFSKPLKRYFLESRNRFASRFYKDISHSADYLDNLRWKVFTICVEKQPSGFSGNHIALYDSIKSDLRNLALTEFQSISDSGVEVDFDYLHGMLCQLTAECNHEWVSLKEI